MASRLRTNPVGGAPSVAAQLGRAVAVDERKTTIERQLRRRIGLAGLLIVLLSVALSLLDEQAPPDDPTTASPQYTAPVPVRKKDPPPLSSAQPAAETPAVLPVIAEPQATGAAIEASLAAAGTEASPGGVLAGETSAAAPVAAAPRPPPGPRLQTSVLPDWRRAEEVQASLAQVGIPASIETRLQLGPFRTPSEAEAARREIQRRGIDAVIVPDQVGKP
jgi:DedD protein